MVHYSRAFEWESRNSTSGIGGLPIDRWKYRIYVLINVYRVCIRHWSGKIESTVHKNMTRRRTNTRHEYMRSLEKERERNRVRRWCVILCRWQSQDRGVIDNHPQKILPSFSSQDDTYTYVYATQCTRCVSESVAQRPCSWCYIYRWTERMILGGRALAKV